MKLAKMQRMGMYRQTKLVNAYPMSRADYYDLRGWRVPDNENPLDKGMLVVTDEDEDNEHLCWKTMEVFNRHYAPE